MNDDLESNDINEEAKILIQLFKKPEVVREAQRLFPQLSIRDNGWSSVAAECIWRFGLSGCLVTVVFSLYFVPTCSIFLNSLLLMCGIATITPELIVSTVETLSISSGIILSKEIFVIIFSFSPSDHFYIHCWAKLASIAFCTFCCIFIVDYLKVKVILAVLVVSSTWIIKAMILSKEGKDQFKSFFEYAMKTCLCFFPPSLKKE